MKTSTPLILKNHLLHRFWKDILTQALLQVPLGIPTIRDYIKEKVRSSSQKSKPKYNLKFLKKTLLALLILFLKTKVVNKSTIHLIKELSLAKKEDSQIKAIKKPPS